jgi:hypothetical protein
MNHDHHYARQANIETCEEEGCEAVMYWKLHKALSEGGRRRRK